MSVKPINVNIIHKNHKQNICPIDYENILFNNWQHYIKEEDDHDESNLDNTNTSRWRHFKHKTQQALESLIKSNVRTQVEVFQSSMRYWFVIGKCLGIIPITNITEKYVDKKYNIFSWRYSLCFITFLGKTVLISLNLYRVLTIRYFFTNVAFLIFLVTNLILSIQFMRLSTKWHRLMKLVATSKLDEYVDPYVTFKCNFATIFLLTFTFIEHESLVMLQINKMRKCTSDVTELLQSVSVSLYPMIFDSFIPYSHGIFIIAEIFMLIITMIWTYSHVFIICVSLCLSSILEGLNKKIKSHENQILPASYWRAMREDYNRAVRLVRFFDDAINDVVFVTLECNLFFTCCRLYFLMGQGYFVGDSDAYNCLKQIQYRYEDIIFNSISAVFLILRALWTLLVAAKIYSASLAVAPLLYSVPPSSYCTEIQRFLEQINSTTVALTGLKCFFVTKEFILSMIEIVVTYELVLVQFTRYY